MNEYKYKIKKTSMFKGDYKLIKKRGYDLTLLAVVISTLAKGEQLDAKYKDHPLKGSFAGLRECHITPDWLLIYEIDDDKLYLYLTRTDTHSDLLE
jgi:mRNA interferase YafQ